MFKKVLIASLAVVIGLAVVANTRVGSHFRAWVQRAKQSMAKQVKPEHEIRRLRMEVERLEQQDKAYFHKVAQQRVDIRDLDKRLNEDRKTLAQLRTRITDLRAQLKDSKSDTHRVSYRENSYTAAEAQEQIDRDYDRYKPLKVSVESQEAYLATLKQSLAQNEEKLFNLEKTRKDMLTQLQTLENELTELKMSKNGRAARLDDSAYGRVQRDIDAVKKRLEVEKEKAKLIGTTGKGPIERAEEDRAKKEQRSKDMDAEFGPGAGKAVVAPKN